MPSRGGQLKSLGGYFHEVACFNSCPHAEGNSSSKGSLKTWKKFQFVPSRGGQLPRFWSLSIGFQVSIRALTRRATCADMQLSGNRKVSIRALTRRATCFTGHVLTSQEFQFVPSRGGQLVPLYPVALPEVFQFVPSRGGQPSRQVSRRWSGWFQFVPSRGGQPEILELWELNMQFQFVPSRGGQPAIGAVGGAAVKFQFVPSRGGQQLQNDALVRRKRVSIRALTRRATFR